MFPYRPYPCSLLGTNRARISRDTRQIDQSQWKWILDTKYRIKVARPMLYKGGKLK